ADVALWRGAGPPGARAGPARAAAEAAERAELTHLVILLPLLRIPERLIRLRDRLESVGGLGVVRILVGMVLGRELPVLLLDFVLARRSGDAEYGVVVLLGHV